MTSVALDTNCIVAVAIADHEHRAETVAALERLDADGAEIVMLGHALLEAYAVLTRLPGAARVSPQLAYEALQASWHDRPVVALTAEATWPLLNASAAVGISGGRVYDGMLAEAASAAEVDVLLTWNARHFSRWSMGTTRVITPRELLAAGE